MNAAAIASALKLRRSGQAYLGTCPRCGYQGFSAKDRSGKTLVRCHAGGCDQADVISALRSRGLWGGGADSDVGSSTTGPTPMAGAKSDYDAEAYAAKLWRQGQPAEGSVVARYLASRGIVCPIPPSLRLLPAAKHRESGTFWPAMLAAVVDVDGVGRGVHRTFLRRDGSGKAAVDPNKKSLGPIAGCAVRLAGAGERLAVSEGIETGFAVQLATGVPVWAALSAGGIRKLILPPLPLAAEVTIAADNDRVGMDAARAAAQCWRREGRKVRIAVPPKDMDFNDVLTARVASEAA